MPGRPYSTRFLSAYGPSGRQVYTVPAGKRAVVRMATLTWDRTTVGACWVAVAGVWAWNATPAGATGSRVQELRATAYAGEVIEIFELLAGMFCTVNGFLFDDIAATATELPAQPASAPDPLAVLELPL